MKLDPSTLKSRSVFQTDADYQAYGKKLLARHNLLDGYSYAISLATGAVFKGKKMKLEADKVSKSDQPK